MSAPGTRPSGSRPTGPARSRSWAPPSAPSRSRAITSRSSTSPGCPRRARRPTRSRSTASACGRRRTGSGRRAACAPSRDDHGLRICFGSCRCAYPNEPPWTLTKDEDPEGRGHDALRALALRMAGQEPDEWPHLLLMLGDQVYADEVAPATEEFIRARRDVEVPPGPADLRLRGVLPAVPRLVVRAVGALAALDGAHGDDLRRPRRHRRLEHVARLGGRRCAPRAGGTSASSGPSCPTGATSTSATSRRRTARRTPATARSAPPTATRARSCATSPSAPTARWPGARWSYKRDIGRTRLVVMDSRAGRVLEPGSRSMVDAEEWDCIEEWTRGDFDHLLLGTSLPVFLGRGMHFLEAWNEAVCDGAWGRLASRAAERLRQGARPRALGRVRRLAARARAPARRHRLGTPRQRPGHRRPALRRRPSRLHRRRAARRRAARPGRRPSTRRCARRCATRWTPASAARSSWR